jgi:hypothetical protein
MKGFIKKLLREGLYEGQYENKTTETDFNTFINKLINDYDYNNIYLSFRSSMNVSKINTNNKYNTPTGIYTYKLSSYFSKKNEWDLSDFYGNSLKFPFASGYPFLHFYVLKDDVNILSKLTDKKVFDDYVLKIKQLFNGNNEIEDKCDRWFVDEEYLNVKNYCASFWLFIYKDILGGKKNIADDGPIGNTNIRFTNLCNKLGIDGFNDNGEGFIHPNEKSQTVFLKPNLFKTIEVFKATNMSNFRHRYNQHKIILSPDINTVKKIITKYGLRDGVHAIVSHFTFKDDREVELYTNVLKDAELGKYFIMHCVNKIPSSNHPIKLIDIIIKNGFINNLYEIQPFLNELRHDNPLFEYILSIPSIKKYLNLYQIIKYNIKNNISLDFVYNDLKPNKIKLDYRIVALLINSVDDKEKMLRFLIPFIKNMDITNVVETYESINGDLAKLMFKLLGDHFKKRTNSTDM